MLDCVSRVCFTGDMTTNTTNQPTIIDRLANMVSNHTTEQLAEMLTEIEMLDLTEGVDSNRRLVKFGIYQVIEQRNPAIGSILETWCSDLNDDRSYSEMVVDALAQLDTTN